MFGWRAGFSELLETHTEICLRWGSHAYSKKNRHLDSTAAESYTLIRILWRENLEFGSEVLTRILEKYFMNKFGKTKHRHLGSILFYHFHSDYQYDNRNLRNGHSLLLIYIL